MLFFFMFVIWIWLLFAIFGDLFRRHDIGGWGKAGWTVLMIVLPFLGVLIYLVTQGKGMAERKAAGNGRCPVAVRPVRPRDGRRVARAEPAAQIAQAKELLDSGAINEQEFEDLKTKALA